MSGELAAAEAGLGKALTLLGSALKHCDVFHHAILAVRFILAGRLATRQVGQGREIKAGFDDVIHIAQGERVALGAVFLSVQRFRVANRKARFHFIAPEAEKADGLFHGDAPDTPAELRLVKDGFEQAARGAGRDDGIAHALDFHFRASEAGEVAPSAEVDSHG